MRIETKRAQRKGAAVRLHRRREINALALKNGRRPGLTGNRLLPGDIVRRAPFGWQMTGFSVALAVRPAELRPVCCRRHPANEYEHSSLKTGLHFNARLCGPWKSFARKTERSSHWPTCVPRLR